MATPFPHVQITHLSRMGRRRSQSVMIPNTFSQDQTAGQSTARKEFLAQLKKERMKHQGKHDEEPEDVKSEDEEKEKPDKDQHRRADLHQFAKSSRTMSLRRQAIATAVTVTTVKKELPSRGLKLTNSYSDNLNQKSDLSGIRIPQIESLHSFEQKHPVSLERRDSTLDSLQSSHNPLIGSSSNLASKSEIFDQDIFLATSKSNQGNENKTQGTRDANQRGRTFNPNGRKFSNRANRTFLIGAVGIMIGVISFAFGLSALILAMMVQSTVNGLLANSTSSSSSNTDIASAACSSYTPITDSSRSIYASGYALGCDKTAPFTNQTTPLWFRFTGSGGTTLPLTTPGMNICGSVGTGWYYGQMPSSGSAVNGTACFTWTSGVCAYSVSISVANCGSFYVYQLPPPPICMARYCTI